MTGPRMSGTPSGSGPAPASPAIGIERTGRPTNDHGWVKTPRCPRVTPATPATTAAPGGAARAAAADRRARRADQRRGVGRGRRDDHVHVAKDLSRAIGEPGAEPLRS